VNFVCLEIVVDKGRNYFESSTYFVYKLSSSKSTPKSQRIYQADHEYVFVTAKFIWLVFNIDNQILTKTYQINLVVTSSLRSAYHW